MSFGWDISMYLKQVEMENFKSFGGKLSVPLMEGYTAITGPNGSGKSNITDAILFVLGPRSSKAVRAGRLTDLIFDGGKSKSKASYMTVTLVFDNKDRLMPWDDDTVRLTRLVRYNDARTDYYSYFYINDRKSTMSEFSDLLTKARISADGYNLVQQGDVTNIVSMGNLERRRIIDGVTGIASYDADIDKASEERTEAETNLERINIVIEELELQLRQLEKDRQDAEKYLNAQSSLDMSKAQLTHRQLQIQESSLESYTNQIKQITEEIETLKERKKQNRIDHHENEIALENKEEEIAAKIGPEYKELKDKIDDVKVKMATYKDRIQTAEDDNEQNMAYRTSVEESVAENNNAVNDLNNLISDVRIKKESSETELEEAKAESEALSRKMTEHGGEHAILQERLIGIEELIDAKTAEENEANVTAAKAESLADDGARTLANLDESIKTISFEINDAEWSLKTLKEEAGPSVEDYSSQILKAKGEERELEKQESELNDAVRRLDTEYGRLMAEKKVSEKMNQGNAAISAILALRDKRAMEGIHGTVQELASVDSEYETAVSVAAGGKMRAIVVEDDDVAAKAINFLKSNKLGRVTFLPMTKMLGGKPRAKAIMASRSSEGYAIDLLKFDPQYENVFWYVMGDTLVMKDLDTARSLMGGVRMVTKQGELIEASGAMVGGTIRQDAILKFGSASEPELESVGNKLGEANDALEGLKSQLRAVRAKIRELDDQMREANARRMNSETKIGGLRAQVSELKKSKESKVEERREKKEQCDRWDAEMKEAKESLAVISAELDQLKETRTEIRERIKEIAPADMQMKVQKVRDRIYELNQALTEQKDQLLSYETEVRGLGKQTESLNEQIEITDGKIRENDKRIGEHTQLRDEAKVELEALRLIESEMEAGIADLREERDTLREKKYSLDSENSAIQEKIESKGGMASSMEASCIAINENIERLKDEIVQITFEVERPIPSEEEIRRSIRSAENIMSRIGNVNLRAIQDYDDKKERYDGLREETNILEERIKELNELTASLNSQKKGLFMEGYDAIGSNFKRIYADLSDGGEGFVSLEDEEDPFLGGLAINAKPKNGKLLRLESLSGGEKSLTALAFIFAIQEYQPSPFYVLDEVDMFLDAVNAEMVAKRIRDSSARAQFIQVSLRKVTLSLADHLIGVTRPPSGVSKVIIQPDFAEVSKLEEEALRQQKAMEE